MRCFRAQTPPAPAPFHLHLYKRGRWRIGQRPDSTPNFSMRLSRRPFEVVAHHFYCRVPASPARAALVVPAKGSAGKSMSRQVRLLGNYDANRQPVTNWWLAVDQMRGQPDAEIVRNLPAQSLERLNGVIFPRRQPELHPCQIFTDLNDLPEMLDVLQVARVVPSEIPVAGAMDEGTHRLYPARVRETLKPPVHRDLNFPK